MHQREPCGSPGVHLLNGRSLQRLGALVRRLNHWRSFEIGPVPFISSRPILKTRGMSADWLTQLDDALTLLFSYFRTVRNDAGHPTGIKLPKEQVSSHLVLFQSYLRLIYDLLDWLPKNNPLPSRIRPLLILRLDQLRPSPPIRPAPCGSRRRRKTSPSFISSLREMVSATNNRNGFCPC
jgi:hypothetical protein